MKYYVRYCDGWLIHGTIGKIHFGQDWETKPYAFTKKQADILESEYNLIKKPLADCYPCKSCEKMERLYCIFGGYLTSDGICLNYVPLKNN